MATFTTAELFDTTQEWIDGNDFWSGVSGLTVQDNEASTGPLSNVGDKSNRAVFYLTPGMFADPLTRSHRLRSLGLEFQGSQGTLISQVTPNDFEVYWKSLRVYRTPIYSAGWSAANDLSVGMDLSQWGFDTSNDGINAMNELFDGDVQIRIVLKKIRSTGSVTAWLRNVKAYISYDDPLPADNTAVFMGAC